MGWKRAVKRVASAAAKPVTQAVSIVPNLALKKIQSNKAEKVSAYQSALEGAQSSASDAMTGVEEAYKRGETTGAEKFKEYFGDSAQYKKDLADIYAKARAGAERGLTAPEYAPIQEQYKTSTRALKAAQGASGMGKGGMASSQLLSQNRALNIAKASKDIEVRQANMQKFNEMSSARATAGLSMPMLYGTAQSGQAATAYGMQNLATNTVTPPTGGGISIICTELKNQNLLPVKYWEADEKHGRYLRCHDPFVYVGYIAVASPIVELMKKSKLLTKAISLLAIPWAKHIAGEHNIFGKFINTIGTPVCRLIGSVTNNRRLYA